MTTERDCPGPPRPHTPPPPPRPIQPPRPRDPWPASALDAIAADIARIRWAPEPYPPHVPTGHIVKPAPVTDRALVGTIHDPRRTAAGRLDVIPPTSG